MTTVSTQYTVNNSSASNTHLQKASVEWKGKEIIPISHANQQSSPAAIGKGASIELIILILGITLWTVGAQNGNAGMLLAGKVITGIMIGLTALTCCCVCCIALGAGALFLHGNQQLQQLQQQQY